MRSALIAAVSDPHQATDDKFSIPSQLESLRAAAAVRGWDVVAEVTIPGQSRYYDWLHEIIRDLPEYARVVDLVEAEAVDVLMVRDYDRLWRTDALRAQMSVLCEQHRVQVYSLNQPTEIQSLDSLHEASEATQLTQIIFGWSAQTENALRSRRRQMGMHGRAVRGLGAHWIHAPYGYTYIDKQSPLQVDPARARWVVWIFERRAAGVGYANIAAQLSDQHVLTIQGGAWSGVAIKQIVHNPVYIGKIRYREFARAGPRAGKTHGDRRLVREELYDGAHEPIISQALWDQVQRINAANRREYTRSNKPAHVMTGMLRCGYCGRAMVHVDTRANHYYHLRCSTYNRSMGRECQPNHIAVRKVLAYVIGAVEAALADRDGFMQAYTAAQTSEQTVDHRAALEGELADIRARQERLLAALESGAFAVEVLVNRQTALAIRARAIETALAALDHADARATAMRATLDQYAALSGHIHELPDADLRALLLNLIRTITIRKNEAPLIDWL